MNSRKIALLLALISWIFVIFTAVGCTTWLGGINLRLCGPLTGTAITSLEAVFAILGISSTIYVVTKSSRWRPRPSLPPKKDESPQELRPFAEYWHILNDITGFRHLNLCYDFVSGKLVRTKKHQKDNEVELNVRELFTDFIGGFHEPRRPVRDKSITIPKLPNCQRCGRPDSLERDHVKPLHLGGRDESSNLQYLCVVCHRFKTTEDKILRAIERHEYQDKRGWRARMWKYRLEVLRKLNPPGKESYASYWNDTKTHYERWYRKPIKRPVPDIEQQTLIA